MLLKDFFKTFHNWDIVIQIKDNKNNIVIEERADNVLDSCKCGEDFKDVEITDIDFDSKNNKIIIDLNYEAEGKICLCLCTFNDDTFDDTFKVVFDYADSNTKRNCNDDELIEYGQYFYRQKYYSGIGIFCKKDESRSDSIKRLLDMKVKQVEEKKRELETEKQKYLDACNIALKEYEEM